ncbi:MAG: penicillin-binding protein activator [Mariprofundales bacterium]
MALLSLLFSACTKHEISSRAVVHVPEVAQPLPAARVLQRQSDAQISSIMHAARAGDLDYSEALVQLQQLQMVPNLALSDEARFRSIQLQLEFDDPYAVPNASVLLQAAPDHALNPYLHYWLAQWMLRHQEHAEARYQLQAAVSTPYATPSLRHQAFNAGVDALRLEPYREPYSSVAVHWLLANVPYLVPEDIEIALNTAAPRITPALLAQLRQQGMLAGEPLAALYQRVARLALMRGRRDIVAQVAEWAAVDVPASSAYRLIHRWQKGSTRSTVIGVLLPLHGSYAHFGQQALRGIRVAVSKLPYGEQIHLAIADSQGSGGPLQAYHQLLAAGSDMILGPLLADSVRQLAPHLRMDVPLLALTNQRDLAAMHGALFIHSAGLQFEAAFLAERVAHQYAQDDGELVSAESIDDGSQPMQVAVLAATGAASRAAAESFRQVLLAQSGSQVYLLTVDGSVDERRQLMLLRRDTDDGLLLDALDEEQSLMIKEQDLTPVVSSGLDAIYLPLSGTQVSRLAGQLAYVGLNRVPLLGDSSWRDGHLFDDHGRYLATARIADIAQRPFLPHAEDADYRQLWGEAHQGSLGAVAFDSLMIAATLTSSWGLQGFPLLRALRDPAGFPLATGAVVFDRQGIGHKQFALLTVRKGVLVGFQDEQGMRR